MNVLGLCWLLRRRLGGPSAARRSGGSLRRTVAATAALALWCAWVEGLLPAVPAPVGLGLARTVLALVGGVAVYVATAAALRAPELRALLGMLHAAPLILAPRPARVIDFAHAPASSQGTPRSWPGYDDRPMPGPSLFGPPTPM